MTAFACGGRLPLGTRDADVWRVSRADASRYGANLAAALSADERDRAARIAVPGGSQRSVLARGVLRALLAAYTGEHPGALRLVRGPGGKPALPPEPGRAGLRFNVSHSGELMLCAVTRGADVGIDVERVDEERPHARVAAHFLTRRERAVLESLPPAERASAFFACWTRKEALVKATGVGMGVSLTRVEVPVSGGAPVATPHVDGHPTRWVLRDLACGPGYRAALATPDTVERVQVLDPPEALLALSVWS